MQLNSSVMGFRSPSLRSSRRRYYLIGLPTISVVLFLILFAAFALSDVSDVSAQESTQAENSAHVVVQFDKDGSIIRTVDFDNEISGLQALSLSGLEVVTTSTDFGAAVCSIEGVGCPADDCFCGGNYYWGYNYWDGSGWQGYPVGAGSSVISQTGAVEGWIWGQFGDVPTPYTVTQAVDSALSWLSSQQVITSGGFGGIGGSVEVMFAFGANNQDADTISGGITGTATLPGLSSLADYVALNSAATVGNVPGAAGKLAVAVAGADSCMPLGAVTPSGQYSSTLGTYSVQNGSNTWSILGSAAISETIPVTALNTLRDSQLANGGWEWAPGWEADTNTTSLAIQALIATGDSISSTAVISGLAFLESVQNEDGGFPYDANPESNSDTNSTAYVVQALAAAQEDAMGARWSISGTTPIDYLLSMQLEDGSFEWQPGNGGDQFATRQAVPALLGRSFPLKVQVPDACPGIHLPAVINSANSETSDE